MKRIVGGGPKKILYALSTVKNIGFQKSAKALSAKNTCKACALGMGGQRGGMTNELNEFPSACNKSIQAQSSDMQAPISAEIFQSTLKELRDLSPKQIENLGRLNTPIYKAKNSQRFKPVNWGWALNYAATRFKQTQAERTFFYSSGRSSNEAGFLLQLLARNYGTNNINNCSYYCHQATSIGLNSTIGTGTATIELDDLSTCDLVFVMGANPASNHPRFIHKLKELRDRGGHIIIINPAKEPGLVKFSVPKSPSSLIAGGTDIASLYLQPKIGTDIALIKGLSKAIIEQNAHNESFMLKHTQYWKEYLLDIKNTDWNILCQSCDVEKSAILKASTMYANSKNTIFAWGMGMTHHTFGSKNIEYIANLALLRGMVGKRAAGLLPLRGHSNAQGIETIGVTPVLTDDVLKKIEQHLNTTLPKCQGLDTYRSLEAASRGEMDCACIVGGNLYAATPNSKWAESALDKISFKLFLTTTLNIGHLHGNQTSDALILPVLARDEEKQSTTQESMFNYLRLSDGGIDRVNNAYSEVNILAELGKRLQLHNSLDFEKFKDHKSIRQAIASTIPGMEHLKDIDISKKEFSIQQRILHTPRFYQADGKARFIIHPLPKLPNDANFPFLLASVRSEGQFNSIIYEETDSYRHQATRTSIMICEGDMHELGVKNGDKVNILSSKGEMKNMTVQCFDLPKGNVLAYYPEANVLTQGTLDPRSKTPNFKSVAVNIIRNQPTLSIRRLPVTRTASV